MQKLRTIAAAGLALALAGPALAASPAPALKPIQDQAIELTGVSGDVYYTVRPDGYHVVATFAERRDDSPPVRFEAVLAPGQSVTVSAPRAAGAPADSVEISRQYDHVFVRRAALVD